MLHFLLTPYSSLLTFFSSFRLYPDPSTVDNYIAAMDGLLDFQKSEVRRPRSVKRPDAFVTDLWPLTSDCGFLSEEDHANVFMPSPGTGRPP